LDADQKAASRRLAIAAESLYLINLMLLPGLGFLLLLGTYLLAGKSDLPLANNHLAQTTGVSVIGGTLIVVVVGAIFLLGGSGPYVWLTVVFYFTFVHSSLIFMGVFGFIKAYNEQHFVYPVLGRFFQS
jgi:hypothetical protein